ncbi:MAG: AsmA family protein [Gammaproteobacteria bacterium]
MKWIVRLLLGLVVMVAVVFGVGAVLLATIDPNDYKDLIAGKVREATGRTLTIEGDIELSFFPWLGLELAETRLSNAAGFGDDPFAQVDGVRVSVALLPLLRREVQADTVSVHGLRLDLSRSADGLTNWDDLLQPKEPERPSQPEKPVEDESSAALGAVVIGGLTIQDAALRWQDAQTGNALVVSPFNLRTGALKAGEPFDLSLDLGVESASPALKASARLTGEVNADLQQQRYHFEGMTLAIDAKGESLPAGGVVAEVKTTLTADLQTQTLNVPRLTLKAMELAMTGQLDVQQLRQAPQIKGSLETAPFSPRELWRQLGIQGAVPADPKVLQRAALQLQFQGNEQAMEIAPLRASLDASTLTGKVRITSGPKPHIRFSLMLDQMDLDRYFPSPETTVQDAEGAPGGEAPAEAAVDTLGIPADTLRELNAAGDFKAGELKVANLQLSNVVAELNAEGGVVAVKPLRADLYAGGVDGGLTVDVRGAMPTFGLISELQGIQVGPLMSALQQGKGYLDGTGEVSVNLRTRGEGVADLKKRLEGRLNMAVTEGALYDKKLAAMVEAAVAFLEGRPARPAAEAIIFESLSGSADVNQGVLSNRDLQLITSLILGKGEGSADLGNDTVDYTLSLALARGDEDKKRVFVPITIKGPYHDLKYGLKLEKVAKERLKHEAERQIEKRLQKIVPQEFSAPLQEGLKGLLGR